jgi:hypothetical protein
MQRTINYPPLALSEPDAKPTLNVVIAYEDFETGKHAKGTCDFLIQHLGHEFQFLNQMWKFDVLSIPKLREMAAKDASMGDIIIISSHGRELSDEVKSWIETWLAEKGNPMALVALFTGPAGHFKETAEVRDYLEGVAKRGQLEFFAQPDEWPGKKSAESFLFNRSLGAGRALSTLAGVVERDVSYPRWGINE